MEVLINIVITIMIILYVFKRMQEVAKKGGSLTGPPPPAKMFGEEEDEEAPKRARPPRRSSETTQMPKRIEFPALPTVRPRPMANMPTAPSRKLAIPMEPPRPRQVVVQEVIRPQHRHVDVPEENAHSREERIRDVVREDEEGRYADTDTGRGPIAHVFSQQRKQSVGARRPLIAFRGNDVMRGIIMKEILGPPVSMGQETPR